MRKLASLLTIAFLLVVSTLNAQALSKKDLLSGLNDTGISGMKPEQSKGMTNINNSLISDLGQVDKKKLSKADRDKEVDRLFDKRDNSVDSLFGKDDNYMKKYKKEYKKKSRSLRMKVKLAKIVM